MSDTFARIIADHLTRTFGQPFIVDNKPGGSGAIASLAVVKAPNDGHTLLFTNASFTAVLQAISPPKSYDLLRDLTPVVQIGASGQFLAVVPAFPAHNLKELISLVRAHPDKYTFGTLGNGSVGHLAMAALQNQEGLKIGHVPYKAGNEVVRDMVGGVLEIGWVDVSSSVGAIQAGQIRPIAISGTFRAPANPEVLTMTEQGYPFKLNGWTGLFAAAGTPPAVIRAINSEVNALLQTEAVKQRMFQMNVGLVPANTPEQFQQTLRDDIQGWTRIVVANGIKPE
ncbi:tripartite tricarboxylate transporter substrate binding protein [Variovorax sp. J22R115]|uniref:Bug family tripartite tricarboxylate transporter substrate binding protein n=1 Tax=Variovorax sp. J22R115 TaxID=3053509 RepID=UPI0025790F7D|nr:tripartite tricarboxylate transporter substrate binding protein [Variovorax sp. J22R115]MDM0054004.1 tripartite tricarboxylate transporter substrate binding protein [Variovorax sp. J22R115]